MPPKTARGRGKKKPETEKQEQEQEQEQKAVAAPTNKRRREPAQMRQKVKTGPDAGAAAVAAAAPAAPKAKRAKKAAAAQVKAEVKIEATAEGGGVTVPALSAVAASAAAAAARSNSVIPDIPPELLPFVNPYPTHSLYPQPGRPATVRAPPKPPSSSAKSGSAEKRPAVFRRGNEAFRMRLSRATSQRMYLATHEDESTEGGLAHSFAVLGSTGNAYTVRICALPSCTCPDWQRHGGNQACKHIIFVYLRVLKLGCEDPVLPQKGLLQSELAELFRYLPRSPDELGAVLANERAQQAYRAAMGGGEEEGKKGEPAQEQLLGDVDECPICFEGIDATNARAQLAICLACHRPAGHQECFRMWAQSRRRDGLDVSCVWCRAAWVEGGAAKADASASKEGYINLAHYTGQSPVRDTSTYSKWGRRGRQWYMMDDGDY